MKHPVHDTPDISHGMVLLLAVASGLIVANLYYAQTLVGPISQATGLSPQAAGLIVTLTQIGYCLGLLFIVPLGDLLENRRLIVTALLFTAAALLVAAFSTSAWLFLAAALAIGLGSVAAQVLVPFAAHLSKEATRGQTVGKVVSGLLMGIMLARPAASLVAAHSSWHVVFGGAAVIILALTAVLRGKLPQRVPTAPMAYPKLIASLWTLFANTPVLRRRAAYHAGLFGSFSLFWTVTPMMLASPEFHLSQTGMAGFALPLIVPGSRNAALALLVIASIVLDMGVAANLVLGQRAIFSLGAEVRSRLNGIYFALFFAGGALGSALGGWVYASYGWHAALLTGMAFPGLALLYWVSEWAESTGAAVSEA